MDTAKQYSITLINLIHYHYFLKRVVNGWNKLTEEAVSTKTVKKLKQSLEKTRKSKGSGGCT